MLSPLSFHCEPVLFQELLLEFESEMQKREHEFRLQADGMSSVVLSHELKVLHLCCEGRPRHWGDLLSGRRRLHCKPDSSLKGCSRLCAARLSQSPHLGQAA